MDCTWLAKLEVDGLAFKAAVRAACIAEGVIDVIAFVAVEGLVPGGNVTV